MPVSKSKHLDASLPDESESDIYCPTGEEDATQVGERLKSYNLKTVHSEKNQF